MRARDTPPSHPALYLAGAILPHLSFSKASHAHPRAFFIVQDNSSSLPTSQDLDMSTSANCPRTPSRGAAGASNTAETSKVTSTPAQPHTIDRIRNADGKASSAAHAEFIKKEYGAHTVRGVSVPDFVRAVFGFDWDDIPPKPCGPGNDYTLSSAEVRKILEASKEVEKYDSLVLLANELLSQVYGYAGSGPDPPHAKERRKEISARRAEKLQSTHAVLVRLYRGWLAARAAEGKGNHGFKDKPDLAYGVDWSTKLEFCWTTVPIEVEKTRTIAAEQLDDVLIEGRDGIFVVKPNPGIALLDEDADTEETGAKEARAKKSKSKAVKSGGPSEGGSGRQSKGKTVSGTSTSKGKTVVGTSTNKGKTVSGTSASTQKRKLDAEMVQASTESSSKRQKTAEGGEAIVNKEAQLLKYINQVMSHNVRSYAIGLLIKDDKLRLVYGDRMGIIFSERIEFLLRDAHLFLLILAAMGFAGVHELGIHPNVHFPRVNVEDPADCEEFFDPEHGYDGAILRLEGQGEDGSETLEYDFDVDENAGRSVYTEFGLIGRGTTVIPVKRRTGTSSSEEESEELVAKVAWPHAARTGEHEYIRKVRQSLKAGGKESILRHIVDMKAALTKDSEAMGLPRHAMGLYPEGQDLRVCRILILKRYRPLDTIGSQAEFHQVFIQVVRAHHWAYTTAHVLHRDISMNNIMWYKCGEEVVGVLCDWDLAEDHSKGDKPAAVVGQSDGAGGSEEGKGKSTSLRRSKRLASRASNQANQVEPAPAVDTSKEHMRPRYRTGTGPFMAIDLLVMELPPPHKYRHDLESFLYLYVCAAVTFDPDQEQTIRVIAQWNQTSLRAIGLLKRRFLETYTQYEDMLKNAPAQFQPAVNGVLQALWLLFFEVDDLANQISKTATRGKYGGESPDVVQRKLAAIESKRDELASYAKFMEILQVPSHEI